MTFAGFDVRVQEYWDWLSVSLFLLLTVDMITTVYAVTQIGVRHEANPIVRWSLLQGPLVFAGVNLVALVLVVVMFDRVIGWLEHVPRPYARYAAAGIETWLGVLLAAGLFLFANNLTVIFYGQSLL